MRTVLREIGADEVPGAATPSTRPTWPRARRARLAKVHEGSVAFSATTGEGVEELLLTVADRLRALTNVVELAVPYDRGDVLAAVHREGEVLSEQADDDGMRLRVRLDDASLGPVRRVRGGVT